MLLRDTGEIITFSWLTLSGTRLVEVFFGGERLQLAPRFAELRIWCTRSSLTYPCRYYESQYSIKLQASHANICQKQMVKPSRRLLPSHCSDRYRIDARIQVAEASRQVFHGIIDLKV